MDPSLQDKVVLVTGAARRVGAEIARLLHAEGASLALHYRSAAAEAQALVTEFNTTRPGSALAFQADLLESDHLPRLVEDVAKHFGRLDALVNNASSFFATPIGSIGEREWNDLLGTNLKAPLFLAQAAASHLAVARGAIVNITDIHAERPLKNYALYCAAKAGLAGLTRALALELGPHVRVNAIAPGPILWPEDDSFDAAAQAKVVSRTALKRCGDPADIARAVRYLLADAPYVTGQVIAVDGGQELGAVSNYLEALLPEELGEKERHEANKLAKRLRRNVGQAIGDFNMIEDGDRVMVCLSGGKDSHALLDILLQLREIAPVRFELVAVNLDQKQPGFPAEVLPAYLKELGVPFHIENQDTYSVVKRVIPEGKTTCSLCSRLRRGVLYRVAGELGATKIALGHHRDDILETLFLNLFYGGKLKAMPPKLVSDDGRHIVIRPLAYCRERDLEAWAALRRFPIIPCDLCGSQEQLKRKETKALLREWDKRFPGRVEKIFAALGNVAPSHLADPGLYDFRNLKATGRFDPEGDRAFDPESFDDPDIIPLRGAEGV